MRGAEENEGPGLAQVWVLCWRRCVLLMVWDEGISMMVTSAQ